MTKVISLDEVKKHNTREELWVVIHNDVYDVSKYADEHPGGEEPLLEAAGSDGTDAFEDVEHSKDARKIMVKYKIGTLPPEERTNDEPSTRSRSRSTHSSRSCGSDRARSVPVHDCSKTWHTDGAPPSRSVASKSEYMLPPSPRIEPRVKAIIVPRESSGSRLKWALLALAGAIIIGFVIKKYAT